MFRAGQQAAIVALGGSGEKDKLDVGDAGTHGDVVELFDSAQERRLRGSAGRCELRAVNSRRQVFMIARKMLG